MIYLRARLQRGKLCQKSRIRYLVMPRRPTSVLVQTRRDCGADCGACYEAQGPASPAPSETAPHFTHASLGSRKSNAHASARATRKERCARPPACAVSAPVAAMAVRAVVAVLAVLAAASAVDAAAVARNAASGGCDEPSSGRVWILEGSQFFYRE